MAANRQFEDEQNFESGGRSSIDGLRTVSTSTVAEMEQMIIRMFNQRIPPMIRGEFNAMLQEFLSQRKEELHLTGMTGNSANMASTSGSQTLQLQFRNGISTPVFTGMKIEGKDHKPFVVALVDGISGQIVNTGDGAAAKVQIVVLKGDCDDEEVESWTLDDFNNNIITEWKGKKILKGITYLKLKGGIAFVGEISFKQNSVWTKNNKCRLGARFEDAVFATSVKEAKTESFLVKDKRCLLYNKHQTPSLSDEVWRLEKISRRGVCHIRLSEEGIKTVKDFRTLTAINPKRLKDMLRVSPKIWKAIVNHAQTCKDDKGVYLYRDVAFNVSGQLMGLVVESHYVPSDKLSDDKKVDAQKLVVSSSENWKEVNSFDDEASLINHLQSQSALNSSQSPSIGLNLVIPPAIADHTNPITSPWVTPILSIGCTNNVTNSIHDNASVMGQSQSTNRSASEHPTSNAPKRQRVDYLHAAIPPFFSTGSPSSMNNPPWSSQCLEPNSLNHEPDLTVDDYDYLQDFDFPQMDLPELTTLQKWKIMLKVVGWIISKKRQRITESIFQTSDDDPVLAIAA